MDQPKRKRLYISGGEGFIDVVEQSSSDSHKRLTRITTVSGARTSFFRPNLGTAFILALLIAETSTPNFASINPGDTARASGRKQLNSLSGAQVSEQLSLRNSLITNNVKF